MSIYDKLDPPQEGDLPAFWKGTTPGDSISGVVANVRIVTHNEYGDAPCIDIQTGVDPATGQPVIVPILGSTNSLYRQIYNTRPEVGGQVRVTFQGYSGRAKLYQLDYQPPAAGVAAASAPQPQAPPQGFAQPGAPATPWASAPQEQAAPAASPQAAAPPWGQ